MLSHVSFTLPELCAAWIHLLLNLLLCGPAPTRGTAGACTAGWWWEELSFLSCTLLSPSEMCSRDRSCQRGEDQRKNHVCCLLAESWFEDPLLGIGEWECARLARTASPYDTGHFVSSLADVMAPTVPQLQVPPCVRQSCQQGEVLRLCAHHPQCPWQPLLCCEPPLHCSGDWVCGRGSLPCHSHPPGELCPGKMAFKCVLRGWGRAGLSKEPS